MDRTAETKGLTPADKSCHEHLQAKKDGQKAILWDTRTHYSFISEIFFSLLEGRLQGMRVGMSEIGVHNMKFTKNC